MINPYAPSEAEWRRRVSLELRKLNFHALGDHADDAAAEAAGVQIGELYRTGSAVKVRVA